ncbi:hypothetical protein KJ819_03375 [Patescibacteria group bacterium]|nr:hypothetical protein [Patescibacteria group bacterium]MBU1500512.1 hypothetical protein [Patescibacteria group bacterium]MBU2080689.1 hypothetical protein [Patescibacteria group bacterium]MBU2123794.1 hypothetical protein [Patescibacteria group bacterium]MBU2194915.1 hypothetical protein [Patescibacteria group bacterium]
MAIPPTIPTSFVPKQPVTTGMRRPQSGMNAFLIVASIIVGVAVVGAGGTFGYKLYLENVRDAKAAELQRAQDAINEDTIEGFIRLRNRLDSAQTLLNQHVYSSQFFDVLEKHTLQSVRFGSLTLSVLDDRSAEIKMEGVARTFNALAAQSEAFASEKRIKRAIFSSITVNTTGTVSFELTAELDPRLVLAGDATLIEPLPESTLPGIDTSVPAATTTPATSSPVL